jgi:hypothetical protein
MTCKLGFPKILAYYYTEVLLQKNGRVDGRTDEHKCVRFEK